MDSGTSEDGLRFSMGISEIAKRIMDEVGDNGGQENVNESVGGALKAGALATLLAIPGIVDAKTIQASVGKDPDKTVDVDDKQVQKRIYDAIGKDKYLDAVQINVIARTLCAECGGESKKGVLAAASVIYNRKNALGCAFSDVIWQKGQFDSWRKFTEADKRNFKIRPQAQAAQNPARWAYCVKVATEMVNGTFVPLGNWNHFYNPSQCSPNWRTSLSNVVKIDNHTYGYIA